MSIEKIQFKQDELISFFIVSDPPENHSDFLPVFSTECQPPLDQSLFTNNWKPKQVYNRQNNRNISLGGSSSTSFGGTTSLDNQNTPIQNAPSAPINTFSPLHQESASQQNSNPSIPQKANSTVKDFQPTTFHPTNLQSTNFQPAPFQPTNRQNPKMELGSRFITSSFQPSTKIENGDQFEISTIQSSNVQITDFHPSTFQPATFQPLNAQAANFHPTNSQTTSFQPVNQQVASFQPAFSQTPNFYQDNSNANNYQQTTSFQQVNSQAVSFQPTYQQPSNFQPATSQTMNFQPTYQHPVNFQPANLPTVGFQHVYSQATNFQPVNLQTDFHPAFSHPTNFQPVNSQTTDFNPSYSHPTSYQQISSPAPNFQPANFQPLNQFHYQKETQPSSTLYSNSPQINQYVTQQNVDTAHSQQNIQSQQEDQSYNQNENGEEEENNANLNENQAKEEKDQQSPDFVYFKPNVNYDSFESVIGEQNDEKVEEEAKQRLIQEEIQRQQNQKRLQESWINNNKENQSYQPTMSDIIADQQQQSSIEAQQQQPQKQQQESWAKATKEMQNLQPQMNDIIADQKVISSIEAQQQKEQQNLQQKNNPAVGNWAESNIRPNSSSPSAFEDIIASQEKSKQSNSSPKPMPKIAKGSGKVTKMSFQDLQRELNKPSQWSGAVTNQPAASISSIFESTAESSSKPTTTSNVPAPVGKGKKGKKKKQVYDFQEFNRMNEEQERANKEAAWSNAANSSNEKKSFSTISAEAIMESEKNRQSLPAPTPAPVTKRANHRGRGKDSSTKFEISQTPKYYDDDEEEDYYREPPKPKNPKQSFDSITNSELAKQSKNQAKSNQSPTPPPTTTNTAANANTSNSGAKSKKKKPKYQPFQDTNQPQSSVWESVSGSNKTPASVTQKKNQISFDQLEQNEKVEQSNKPSNAKASSVPASNVSAVQPKKKKKSKKITYIDNYIKNQQESVTPYYFNDDSYSDDDYYYNTQNKNKPSNYQNFNELLNNEEKNVKKKPKQQTVNIPSFSAKSTSSTKKASFESLYQQEISEKEKTKSRPPPPSSSGKGFASILKSEQELKNADDSDVKIIDDSDIKIPSKNSKNSRQQMQKGSTNAGYQSKKSSKKIDQDANNDLFWGATTKDDAYINAMNQEDDVDNNDDYSFKPKKPRNDRAAYLQKLIEQKTGDHDDDLYDFACELINKDKNGLIRSLRTVLQEGDAKSVAEAFFNRYK